MKDIIFFELVVDGTRRAWEGFSENKKLRVGELSFLLIVHKLVFVGMPISPISKHICHGRELML